MERIKQALDKARQERQIREGTAAVPTPAGKPRQDSRGIQYGQSPTITVDDDVLRENRIVTGLEPGPFSDSYNLLRTQVLQRFRENNWNVLAVTSPGSGAGKTLTAINLAISIAREVDYTVLLVDANLRHPWMLEHFGLAERKGLSDYLTSDTPIEELLVRPSRVEHLVLLPGGQRLEHSAEMLSSPKMEELVREMKSRYRPAGSRGRCHAKRGPGARGRSAQHHQHRRHGAEQGGAEEFLTQIFCMDGPVLTGQG
jgi:Mrp family chromosome partitioning ATPase